MCLTGLLFGSAQSGLPTLFICKCHACSALYIIPHALNWTQFNILHKNAHFGHKHCTTDYHYILLDFLKKSAKNAMVVMFLKCLQLKMHTEIFNGKNDRMSGMCFKFFQKEKKKSICVSGGEEMKLLITVEADGSFYFCVNFFVSSIPER